MSNNNVDNDEGLIANVGSVAEEPECKGALSCRGVEDLVNEAREVMKAHHESKAGRCITCGDADGALCSKGEEP
jgi:hypothetical protein